MRILVIASTPVFMFPSPKNPDYVNALKKAGLQIPSSDIENETLYMNAAKGYAKRAKDLFQGSFRRIVKGVEDARSVGIKADLFLISPRYGVVTENDLLLPYNFRLTGKSKGFLRALSGKLRTKELVSELLKVPYDLCVIIANRSDLLLLHDPRKGFDLSKMCKKLVVLSAPSMAKDFTNGAEFIGISRVRGRADHFVKIIDKMTRRTLKDYSQ
ncbi:MAG: hypothetical protein LUQ46_01720 [Candidatus Methanomethyliaceae archaeon]|nr:hypothetical protein [Candidatus Methanomethyliaceae archaeon]MDD1766799.1 hypothetical protein [Candidatus Methanomethyliaceae archaeon]